MRAPPSPFPSILHRPRPYSPKSPPTDRQLNQITDSAEETATYVTELTRSLAETPYLDSCAEFNVMYNKCVRAWGMDGFGGVGFCA